LFLKRNKRRPRQAASEQTVTIGWKGFACSWQPDFVNGAGCRQCPHRVVSAGGWQVEKLRHGAVVVRTVVAAQFTRHNRHLGRIVLGQSSVKVPGSQLSLLQERFDLRRFVEVATQAAGLLELLPNLGGILLDLNSTSILYTRMT
jgi:hypothetical protein